MVVVIVMVVCFFSLGVLFVQRILLEEARQQSFDIGIGEWGQVVEVSRLGSRTILANHQAQDEQRYNKSTLPKGIYIYIYVYQFYVI